MHRIRKRHDRLLRNPLFHLHRNLRQHPKSMHCDQSHKLLSHPPHNRPTLWLRISVSLHQDHFRGPIQVQMSSSQRLLFLSLDLRVPLHLR